MAKDLKTKAIDNQGIGKEIIKYSTQKIFLSIHGDFAKKKIFPILNAMYFTHNS